MTAGTFGAVLAGQNDLAPIQIGLGPLRVQLPPPPWQTESNADAESDYRELENGNDLIFEYKPKGSDKVHWREKYAVWGTVNSRSLEAFINRGIGTYTIGCGTRNVQTRTRFANSFSNIMVVYCQNSPNGPQDNGYGNNVGVISVIWSGFYRNTGVSVMQQWRGAAFAFDDPSSWPVSEQEINATVERLKQVKLMI